jgi:hypothetical protein
MAQRQLNIRSDEAAAEPVDVSGLTPDQRRRSDAILQAAQEFRRHVRPDADWDASWMYDENGLPK